MKIEDFLPGFDRNGTRWTWEDWAVWFALTIAIGAIGFGTIGLIC